VKKKKKKKKQKKKKEKKNKKNKKKNKKKKKMKTILTLRQKNPLQTFTNLFHFIISFGLGLKNGHFLSGFPTKILGSSLFSPIQTFRI
jgi:hypothetical protein